MAAGAVWVLVVVVEVTEGAERDVTNDADGAGAADLVDGRLSLVLVIVLVLADGSGGLLGRSKEGLDEGGVEREPPETATVVVVE